MKNNEPQNQDTLGALGKMKRSSPVPVVKKLLRYRENKS